MGCHASGAAGAPKLGDAAAWAPRIGTGYAALLNSALKGKGNMGAQGGGDHGELEIGRAVVYMANQAGGNPWVEQLLQRCHVNEAAVALANKMTRTAWVLLTRNETCCQARPV